MTTLDYIGIHNDDIEHAAEIVEDVMKECGFDVFQIDGMFENFHENLDCSDSFWDDPTNYIINCLFNTASEFIESRTDKTTDFYVNGWDSYFSVEKEAS